MLLLPSLCMAQTADSTWEQYAVRYIKEHLFLRNGDDFNVVDLDLEWPEATNHQAPKPLQHYLADKILHQHTADFDSAYHAFRTRHGQPVAGQLEKLPDDDRFCYITASLKAVAYDPTRWICYRMELADEPGPKSKVAARRETLYVVYDMERQRVMEPGDVVKQHLIQAGNVEQSFFDMLFAPLSDHDFEHLQQVSIVGAWFEHGGTVLALRLHCTTPERLLDYDVRMPYEAVRYVVTKEGRRLVEKKAAMPSVPSVTAPTTWQGDTVYKQADQMPIFRNGQEGLRHYLAGIVAPEQSKPGKVVLSYVVDKEGWVKDVRVVSPLTTDLDRHAVALAKGMPRYTPAQHGGQPVCVRIYTPIYYK